MGWFDFNANADPADPSSGKSLELRRQIALTMMQRDKKGYPKNLGEGLTAIGDALAERSQMNALQNQLAAYEKYSVEHPPPDAATLLQKSSDASDTMPATKSPVVAQDDEPAPAETAAPTVRPAQMAAATPQPDAQDAMLSEVTGMNRPPPPPAYAPTALAAPPVQSDMPPVTGALPVVAPPGNARDAIAAQLALRQPTAPGVPLPNPMQPAGATLPSAPPTSSPVSGPAPALPGSPPNIPPQAGLPAAPPGALNAFQVAQGPAPGIPQINRVTPPVTMPPPGTGAATMPPSAPISPAEIAGTRLKQQGIQMDDDHRIKQGDLMIEAGKAQRLQQDADAKAQWQANEETKRQRQLATEGRETEAGVRQSQLTEAQAKAQAAVAGAKITERTGLPPELVQAELSKRLAATGADVSLLKNARVAKAALEGGVYSGAGANFKIDLAKARAFFGDLPSSELVSRAEMLAASTQAMVKYGLNQYQPDDPRITNSDLIAGKAIVGGTPTQQMETQKSLVNMVLQDANKRIGEYERYHDWAVGGLPPEEGYRLRVDPIHADPSKAKAALDILLDPKNINDPYIQQKFDARFGPGSAELEIARAGRRAARGR